MNEKTARYDYFATQVVELVEDVALLRQDFKARPNNKDLIDSRLRAIDARVGGLCLAGRSLGGERLVTRLQFAWTKPPRTGAQREAKRARS